MGQCPITEEGVKCTRKICFFQRDCKGHPPKTLEQISSDDNEEPEFYVVIFDRAQSYSD